MICAASAWSSLAWSASGSSPTSSSRPSQFFSAFFDGINNGALYALIALGYTLVYGIIELINFAHGDLFMLGTVFAAYFLVDWLGVSESGASRPGSGCCWRWSSR